MQCLESGGGSVQSVSVSVKRVWELCSLAVMCTVSTVQCAAVSRECAAGGGGVHAVFTDFSPLFSVQCLDSRECSMFSVQYLESGQCSVCSHSVQQCLESVRLVAGSNGGSC